MYGDLEKAPRCHAVPTYCYNRPSSWQLSSEEAIHCQIKQLSIGAFYGRTYLDRGWNRSAKLLWQSEYRAVFALNDLLAILKHPTYH